MDYIKRLKILFRLKNEYVNNSATKLIYKSPFELLIAVLLSAQTNDMQVNKVTSNLFKFANTPKSIFLLGIERLKHYIKSIGLFNIKARNIIRMCAILIERYDGLVPNTRIELESLPGVGRKTASIILNLVFNHSTIAVDRHVFRFCNRSGFAPGKSVLSVEKKLLLVVPKHFQRKCHQWFISHGKNICRARNPLCVNCNIQDLCEFVNKHLI